MKENTRILLNINELNVSFFTNYGEVQAVRNVSLNINESEVVGLVGESGCGKSVTSLSVLNLLQKPAKILKGSILLNDKNILQLNPDGIRDIRGKEISMIFQEPMTSLNPVFTIGAQIEELFQYHTDISSKDRKEKSLSLLKSVRITDPDNVYHYYPHQLSGGMRQRVMIAMALALQPKLIIADEPTTALDVTVQAQILKLLLNLQKDYNISILFITHDLAVISEIADRIYVMYAGEIVEFGSRDDIFNKPLHPYTQALFQAIPGYNNNFKELKAIPGNLPDNINLPQGCKFLPRCPYAKDICHQDIVLQFKEENHCSRCVL